MLPKDNTLKKTRDLNLLMKNGRWVSEGFLLIKYLKLSNLASGLIPKSIQKLDQEEVNNFKKQLRIAVSVGLKVSKSAVKRNKIKRQLHEVLRPLLKTQKLASGYYLLINTKPNILEKDFAEISQELKLLLQKTKVYNP